MTRSVAILVFAGVCLGSLVMPGNAEGQATFFVAIGGNDANPGTEQAPFATLEGAKTAIRNLKAADGLPQGGATVNVREGVYSLPSPLTLTQEDSGSEGAPIVYRAYGQEHVRLRGGVSVGGFEHVTDESVLARIPEEARASVMQSNLRRQGIEDFGVMQVRGFSNAQRPAALELFFQDKPMPPARWPNVGEWATIADTPDGKDGGKFTYEGDRPSRWLDAEDLWLHGYWTQDWADSYVKVDRIEPDSSLIVTKEPHGVYGYTTGKRWCALNLLEEIDTPGEWYLNRDTGILYFWPPAPIEEGSATVSLIEDVLVMESTEYVTIQGFVIECCRGVGVTVTGGAHNLIAGCVVRNVGTSACQVKGGESNGVQSCDISQCDTGVSISGGDRETLTPCGNFAVNNHIHDYGRWCRTYRPAVSVHGVGIRVAHNLIHNGPHNGIQLGGNENVIEYNELHTICLDTGDVGAFYMGRDWTMRGNIIRHNFFHDIHGPYTHGAMAVYLDDCASGATIFGNVFVRASRAAFIGGGRDNTVENNVFVDCNPGVHIDSRGLGWAKGYAEPDGSWKMYEKLAEVNHTQPPYSERYPKLATIESDDPPVPKGNVIVRNVFFGGKFFDLSKEGEEFATIAHNFTEGDPGFVDAAGLNFQLRDGSPVYSQIPGFQRIPFEEIGLQADEYRRAAP